MANPNIATAANIYGRSQGAALSTGNSTLAGSVPSNRVYKVNSLIVSNVNGSTAADVTVFWYDSSAATNLYLAYTITVPADATLVVLSKDTQIYLEEGDYIQASCSANSVLQATCSYEEIYA
jgi:hypothetical protein